MATFPAGVAREIVELCGRFDVRGEALLSGLGLSVESLSQPGARVDQHTFGRLVARARELSSEPGLPYLVGLHMRASTHGFLGFAAMTAGTLGEALRLAERFGLTRTDALALVSRVEGQRAEVHMEERAPLGDLREVVATALLIGVATIAQTLASRELEGEIEVMHEQPPYFARLEAAVPQLRVMRFGRAHNRLVFPASTLALPIVSADPVALRLAREQCERELSQLGEGAVLLQRVRAVLRDEGFVSQEHAARRLSVSPRTLKRRLAEQGTTYSDIVDEARKKQAMVLLEDARLTLGEIAERLGYSDIANFTRAFKRWTGKTPGEARRR